MTSKYQHLFGTTTYSKRRVMAGVVMCRDGDVASTGEVVCVSSGTKCINGEQLSLEGCVINDSHAEIVTRRCLLVFLYKELEKFVQVEEEETAVVMNGDSEETVTEEKGDDEKKADDDKPDEDGDTSLLETSTNTISNECRPEESPKAPFGIGTTTDSGNAEDSDEEEEIPMSQRPSIFEKSPEEEFKYQ